MHLSERYLPVDRRHPEVSKRVVELSGIVDDINIPSRTCGGRTMASTSTGLYQYTGKMWVWLTLEYLPPSLILRESLRGSAVLHFRFTAKKWRHLSPAKTPVTLGKWGAIRAQGCPRDLIDHSAALVAHSAGRL